MIFFIHRTKACFSGRKSLIFSGVCFLSLWLMAQSADAAAQKKRCFVDQTTQGTAIVHGIEFNLSIAAGGEIIILDASSDPHKIQYGEIKGTLSAAFIREHCTTEPPKKKRAPRPSELPTNNPQATSPRLQLGVPQFNWPDYSERTNRIINYYLTEEFYGLQRIDVTPLSTNNNPKGASTICRELNCWIDLARQEKLDELIFASVKTDKKSPALRIERINLADPSKTVTEEVPLTDAGAKTLLNSFEPSVSKLFPDEDKSLSGGQGLPNDIEKIIAPPPVPKWVYYTLSVLSGLGAFTGGLTAYLSYDNQSSYNSASPGIYPASEFVEYQNKGRRYQSIANISLIVAATTGLGATASYFFADWENYGDKFND